MSCPFALSTATVKEDDIQNSSTQAQLQHFVEEITSEARQEEFQWPDLTTVAGSVSSANYSFIIENKADFIDKETESKKVLCANGYITTVRVDCFPNSPYSGLLRESNHGIIRLSSAINFIPNTLPWYAGSIANAQLFPCVALKVFRDNQHSGNLLFAGKKTGQDSRKFFWGTVCTHLTEKMSMFMSWAYSIFKLYSSYPNQLGTSDFCQITGNGLVVSELVFPWCVALHPNDNLKELMFEDILSIPEGTLLYEIYAFPSPAAAIDSSGCGLQRIGRITTTRSFLPSPADSKVFFKHQKKEEDYILRPEWLAELNSLHTKIGSSMVENAILQKNYSDFESSN